MKISRAGNPSAHRPPSGTRRPPACAHAPRPAVHPNSPGASPIFACARLAASGVAILILGAGCTQPSLEPWPRRTVDDSIHVHPTSRDSRAAASRAAGALQPSDGHPSEEGPPASTAPVLAEDLQPSGGGDPHEALPPTGAAEQPGLAGSPGAALPEAAGGPEAATQAQAAAKAEQVRILWRGEPLEVELVDQATADASAESEPWVLADLWLSAEGGTVASARLRSNGHRLDVPLGTLHLSVARTRSAAWWAVPAREALEPGQAGGSAEPTKPTQTSEPTQPSEPPAAARQEPDAGRTDPPAPPPGPSPAPSRGSANLAANDNPEGLTDRHSSLFGERESERLEGELSEQEAVDGPGRPLVVRLRSANNHYHRVLLAPPDHLAAREVRLAVGAKLVVRGVRTRDSRGSSLLVARELELEGRTLTLRSETGVPRWLPAPEPPPAPVPVVEAPPEPTSGAPADSAAAEEPAAPAEAPAPALPAPAPAPPLVQDGRLSAMALLSARLELRVAPDRVPQELSVSGLVLDLDLGAVPFLALRAPGEREESWLWIPWEALRWSEGHAHLALPPGAEGLAIPSGGVDARTRLPGDQVLRRSREFWLGAPASAAAGSDRAGSR